MGEFIIGLADIAKAAGLSQEEAQRRIDRGTLPARKMGTGLVLTRTALQRWKEDQRAVAHG